MHVIYMCKQTIEQTTMPTPIHYTKFKNHHDDLLHNNTPIIIQQHMHVDCQQVLYFIHYNVAIFI